MNRNRHATLGKNSNVEIVAHRDALITGRPLALCTHATIVPDNKARFAMSCIERWGMVAAEPDGEDSQGRAKLRRLTAGEVAKHACDCADLAFSEFHARGWLVEVPTYSETIDALQELENAND